MIKNLFVLAAIAGCKANDHAAATVDAPDVVTVDAPDIDAAVPVLVPPPGAVAGGYATNVYASDFSTLASIDLDNTQAAGFAWYATCWYCGSVTPKANLSIVDGALRLTGSSSLYGVLAGKHGVVGNEYAHGAYFEARLAFAMPADHAGSWPSFWALPNLAKEDISWPGNTATVAFNNTNEHYNTSMEIDIMEFMPLSEVAAPMASSTLHDWYGYQGYSCPTRGQFGDCEVASSFKAKDTAALKYESTSAAPVFHTFGALWVPWDPVTPDVPGYVQFYVDDVALGGKTTWIGVPPSTANPVGMLPGTPITNWSASLPPWTMGSTDLEPHGLILDTGGNAFMDVAWVRVWQR